MWGKTYDYKIVLLGDADSGKSSCFRAFAKQEFDSLYTPTIGAAFNAQDLFLDENYFKLKVWDTAGQHRYRTLLQLYCRGAEGIVIVYNTSRQETFDNVPYWIEKYAHPDATVMMLGSKSDLTEEKVVSYETAKDLANEKDILFFEVSAKDGTNIELALTTFVAKIHQEHGNGSRNNIS